MMRITRRRLLRATACTVPLVLSPGASSATATTQSDAGEATTVVHADIAKAMHSAELSMLFRGETESAQRLLTEAQTYLREGGGGQELSWAISNALVDTRTHDLLVEATNRYQASLSLPPDEWARMVCSDGEAWRARTRPKP